MADMMEAASSLPFESHTSASAMSGPHSDQISGPLFFPEEKEDLSCFYDPAKDTPIPCLVCSELFSGDKAREEFLQHLFSSHKIVVHKTSDITSLRCYAEYWRRRFTAEKLKEVVPVIRTNPDTEDPPENFYLLSEALPEDKEVRLLLQRKRLDALLEVQQRERTDCSFHRRCLFCPETFTGNRSLIFQHMLEAHNFNIGLPDNIVFVSEFLDSLQRKLESMQCLFCERTFRDQSTLRDHMRKKQHRKIDPQNKAYDRFYMINYLEMGKSWEQIKEEEEEEDRGSNEVSASDDWSDWEERESPLGCLFCPYLAHSREDFSQHMVVVHGFDFHRTVKALRLDYYAQVKMVNYIRRKVHQCVCIYCQLTFPSSRDLLNHLEQAGHYLLPDNRPVWDQAQYLFPTYENDSLLCVLQDES